MKNCKSVGTIDIDGLTLEEANDLFNKLLLEHGGDCVIEKISNYEDYPGRYIWETLTIQKIISKIK